MSIAYECQECRRPWPYSKAFAICPACRTACLSATATPMTADQTRRELNVVEFERRYAEHDAARVGPSPEEIGRAEARTLIELDRSLG